MKNSRVVTRADGCNAAGRHVRGIEGSVYQTLVGAITDLESDQQAAYDPKLEPLIAAMKAYVEPYHDEWPKCDWNPYGRRPNLNWEPKDEALQQAAFEKRQVEYRAAH